MNTTISSNDMEKRLEAMYKKYLDKYLESPQFQEDLVDTYLSNFRATTVNVWIEHSGQSYVDPITQEETITVCTEMQIEVVIEFHDSREKNTQEETIFDSGLDVEETGKSFYENCVASEIEDIIDSGRIPIEETI